MLLLWCTPLKLGVIQFLSAFSVVALRVVAVIWDMGIPSFKPQEEE